MQRHMTFGLRTAVLAIAILLFHEAPMTPASSDETATALQQPGAETAIGRASVYWVGHSLVEQKAETASGQIDLMTLVGKFAAAKGLGYEMGDHTLWGSSMSALWQGRPHSYDRDASEMIKKREAFVADPGRYDTLVVTEGIPLESSLKAEFSAYYLRRFACTLRRAVPQARIFLYQSWVHYQASDVHSGYGPAHLYDWRAAMKAQRKVWEELADTAETTSVRAPGGWLSFAGLHATGDGGCADTFPVSIIPVGNAMLEVDARIAAPRGTDDFTMADGRQLTTGDLFRNAYAEWPPEWPLAPGTAMPDLDKRLADLKPRDPSVDVDDVHSSAIGIHLTALVHFATLYRQPPLDLPYPESLTAAAARTLECIAWETVIADPRSGVTGKAVC